MILGGKRHRISININHTHKIQNLDSLLNKQLLYLNTYNELEYTFKRINFIIGQHWVSLLLVDNHCKDTFHIDSLTVSQTWMHKWSKIHSSSAGNSNFSLTFYVSLLFSSSKRVSPHSNRVIVFVFCWIRIDTNIPKFSIKTFKLWLVTLLFIYLLTIYSKYQTYHDLWTTSLNYPLYLQDYSVS